MDLHVVFQVVFGHAEDWSDPARLDTELAYLSEITLPSLAAQTHSNFRLLVLCDDAHDEETRNRIRHAIWARLDRRKAKVIFRGQGDAAKFLTKSTNGRWDDRPWRVQIALDHDSAVASDYVARIRATAKTRIRKMRAPDDYLFLAFGTHYSLNIGDGDAQLYEKPSRRGDSGLALLAPHGHGMSPQSFRGQPISNEHPIDLIGGSKPFVLALFCPRAIKIARPVETGQDDRALLDAAKRFGWLGRAIDALPAQRVH
ncbi:glycosyltransferase [Pseudaestuariivita atlantica]|uniref:Uncharacterized protein n=1 Tax=Pseudaestuariivita atlantica TaxID=1317121 RepID=A0A0L1JU16_9RHOB|nr:glycosyltransferase [Pseudaestuariivita atlantica]KNG95182.1 hypothetical protein ATO11_00600 [Pseudaestuariivita atlantica]